MDAFTQSGIAKFLYGLAHFPAEVIINETVDAMARRVDAMLPEFANQAHFYWGLQVRPLDELELLSDPECWRPAVELMAWLLAVGHSCPRSLLSTECHALSHDWPETRLIVSLLVRANENIAC